MSCLLAYANKCSPGVVRNNAVPKKEGVLSQYKYKTRDFVSADQFVVETTGWLPSGFCREAPNR